MLKKILTLVACSMLAFMALATPAAAAQGAAVTSPQAAASLAPGYYWVSICSSASPRDCPFGAVVFWFGPYSTLAVCLQSRSLAGVFNTYPYTASSCFPQ